MTQKKSNLVPAGMQQKYADIMTILKDFCLKNLNEEYLEMCGYLCAALCRKRPSPLLKGKANTWACSIIHAIGMVNFLFDPSQDPHMPAGELYKSFGVSSSTGSSKSKEIRDMFRMAPLDPDWTLKSRLDDNPMAWMIMVNGFAIDARNAPREIQEAAFRKGLIPYIPGEKPAVKEPRGQWVLNTEAEKSDKSTKGDTKEKKKKEKMQSPQEALREAYSILSKALDSRSKNQRVKLAKQAIEMSEDCTQAYILLGDENLEKPEVAKEYYEEAIEAGKRGIGEKNFKDYEGHFWLAVETRPYMEAKFRLADILWILDEREKAIEHLKEMLRLNPNDNQGIRYTLINWLIEEKDFKYLEDLLNEYEDDIRADFQYGTALYYFVKEDMVKAVEHLHKAMKQNPHVPYYLLGYKRIPRKLPDYIGLGDESEAQVYAAHAGRLWEETYGANDWLKHNLPYQLSF